MYGSANAAPRAVSLTAGPPAGGASGNGGMTSDHQGILAVLGTFLVAYVAWIFIQRQESVERSLEPHNVAVNLHNILVLTATAILGINIAKVLAAKLAGWKVPGAKSIAAFIGNA